MRLEKDAATDAKETKQVKEQTSCGQALPTTEAKSEFSQAGVLAGE